MLHDRPKDPQEAPEARRVLEAIRQIVSEGRLPSDGRLPTERQLAAELEAGRASVRRALDRLETEGLIWRRQGKGTFAGQPPDPTEELAAQIASDVDPLSAMEARLCIEPALADLCARRATQPPRTGSARCSATPSTPARWSRARATTPMRC